MYVLSAFSAWKPAGPGGPNGGTGLLVPCGPHLQDRCYVLLLMPTHAYEVASIVIFKRGHSASPRGAL